MIDLTSVPHHEAVAIAGNSLCRDAKDLGLYRHNGRLVRAVCDSSELQPVTKAGMLVYLSQVEHFVRKKRLVKPDPDIAQALLDSPPVGIPEIRFVSTGPILAPNGQVLAADGCYPDLGIMVSAGHNQPASPAPSPQEVLAARDLLLEPLAEFPFQDEVSWAAALALVLTFFLRPFINGCVPLYLIEAVRPGTGKTLLAALAYCVFSRCPLSPTTLPMRGNEEEARRKLVAKLSASPEVVFIDNLAIGSQVASDSLASILTSETFEDRIVRTSGFVRVANRAVWVATGNNVALSTELSRRTVRIRLNASEETPWTRTGFKYPDLMAWLVANRTRLRDAALTLIAAWVAGGCRPGSTVLGSFRRFSEVVGGILAVAGMPDFLAGPQPVDREDETMRTLVAAWYAEHASNLISARQFVDLCVKTDSWPQALVGKAVAAQVPLAGAHLTDLRDAVFDGYRIELVRDRKLNVNKYRLVPLAEKAPAAGVVGGEGGQPPGLEPGAARGAGASSGASTQQQGGAGGAGGEPPAPLARPASDEDLESEIKDLENRAAEEHERARRRQADEEAGP